MTIRLKLGISTCLLGENVRYDGGHKLDRFLRDTLGRYVDYVPVCPEGECGFPIPREAPVTITEFWKNGDFFISASSCKAAVLLVNTQIAAFPLRECTHQGKTTRYTISNS